MPRRKGAVRATWLTTSSRCAQAVKTRRATCNGRPLPRPSSKTETKSNSAKRNDAMNPTKPPPWPTNQEDFDKAMSVLVGMPATELTRFLTERGAAPECQSCGANNWAVSSPFQGGMQSFSELPLQFSLRCENCAFVRQHDALIVARWKLLQGGLL